MEIYTEEIIALWSHDLDPVSHESRQLIDQCFPREPEPREILLSSQEQREAIDFRWIRLFVEDLVKRDSSQNDIENAPPPQHTHRTYLLSSTHQPQYGSCAPRHSPQFWNRLHCCTFTMETWNINKWRIFKIVDFLKSLVRLIFKKSCSYFFQKKSALWKFNKSQMRTVP